MDSSGTAVAGADQPTTVVSAVAPSLGILWDNTNWYNQDVRVWKTTGTTVTGDARIGRLPNTSSYILGAGDFNGDGEPDIIINDGDAAGGRYGVWWMKGLVPYNHSYFTLSGDGWVPFPWHLSGVADFNRDGQVDILWQNWETGEVGHWVMQGKIPRIFVNVGYVPVDNSGPTPRVPWRAVAAADFSGDGKADVAFENIDTGERGLWVLKETGVDRFISWGVIPTEWHIAGAADFTGDGQPDVLWQNVAAGIVGVWTMSGTTPTAFVHLGTAPTEWAVRGAMPISATAAPMLSRAVLTPASTRLEMR